MKRTAPRFGGIVVGTALVWGSSVVSATLAIVRADWVVLVPAVSAAVAGAGWFVAVRQWALWRLFAESAVGVTGAALVGVVAGELGPDHPLVGRMVVRLGRLGADVERPDSSE